MTFTELEFVLGISLVVVLWMYFHERSARCDQRREFVAVLVGLHQKQLALQDHGDYIEIIKVKGANNG